MKKLLAMYICVSALIYGFDTNASGLDMPPHDNSYTHYSLVPESVFDNSSSYQIARTYFMPDYQRNLVGKRVNDGGKGKNDKNCGMYGYVDSCPEHRVGSGVKHPIPGLTCYKECVCDTSYYKYNSSNCILPRVLGGETCVDEPDDTDEIRTTLYSQCGCSDEYNLKSCPAGATCSECGGKYKQTGCKSEYDRSSQITSNASCSSCSYNGTTKYKCTCNSGYTLSGNECVKIEDCSAYPLTVCPAGGTCSECPDNSAKLKLDSCDTSKGWKLSGNTCEAISCPAGYAANVATCSTGSYSSNGYSGGKVCGKCTLSDECPTGYSKTVCTSTQKETGRTTTEAGTTCYKCEAKDDTCPSGYQKSACSSTQKQTGTTTTEAGTTCYQCVAKDNNCPSGYTTSACNTKTHNQVTTETEAGTTCYKCTPKDDTCPSGYSKTVCTSSQKQMDTKNTAAGSICYQCKDDTCPSGYSKTACTSSQKQMDTKNTAAGSTCYQCKDDTCPSGYQKSGCSSSQVQTGETATTDAGTTCYQCKNDTCPSGYQKSACAASQKQTGTATTDTGTTCYQCEDVCKEWKEKGYTVIASDADLQPYYNNDDRCFELTGKYAILGKVKPYPGSPFRNIRLKDADIQACSEENAELTEWYDLQVVNGSASSVTKILLQFNWLKLEENADLTLANVSSQFTRLKVPYSQSETAPKDTKLNVTGGSFTVEHPVTCYDSEDNCKDTDIPGYTFAFNGLAETGLNMMPAYGARNIDGTKTTATIALTSTVLNINGNEYKGVAYGTKIYASGGYSGIKVNANGNEVFVKFHDSTAFCASKKCSTGSNCSEIWPTEKSPHPTGSSISCGGCVTY